MIESKNFRASCLIDLPKILPPPPLPQNPSWHKRFLFYNNTKVISQVLFCPLFFSEEKGGTSNPEQIKMTFELFLLYFFSWADFFGEAVIWGLNPTTASRLLTNHCWALLFSWLWSHLLVRRFREKSCTVPANSKQIGNNYFIQPLILSRSLSFCLSLSVLVSGINIDMLFTILVVPKQNLP